MTRILPHDDRLGFATRAVHAGQIIEPLAGAVMTPIYQTSTYVQEGLGKHRGYEYARTQNPTREALERNVASLEGGSHGFAFGSGLAALDAVLKLLRAGDHVVCGDNVYGGTQRLMEQIYAGLGLAFTFVDMRDLTNVERALAPATRLVYCETPRRCCWSNRPRPVDRPTPVDRPRPAAGPRRARWCRCNHPRPNGRPRPGAAPS